MDRQELRKTISQELEEPFFMDMHLGYGTKAGGPNPVPTTLWDKANKLTDSWIYFLSGVNEGLERRILRNASGVIATDPALGGTWATDDLFEIHARTSATQKNLAINSAIREAIPLFHVIDEVEITIPALDDDGHPTLELTSGLPVCQEITKAWWRQADGSPRVKVDDILPHTDGTVVTAITLPYWLASQVGSTLILETFSRPSVLTDDDDTIPEPMVRFVQLRAMYNLLMSGGSSSPERDWETDKFRAQVYNAEAEGHKKSLKMAQPMRTRWRPRQRELRNARYPWRY